MEVFGVSTWGVQPEATYPGVQPNIRLGAALRYFMDAVNMDKQYSKWSGLS